MSRLKRWMTTGIGTWGYPPGFMGVVARVLVALIFVKATIAVVFGMALLVYVIAGAI